MGNIIRHGVEMYQQTLNLKNKPEDPAVKSKSKITKHSKPVTEGEFYRTGAAPVKKTPEPPDNWRDKYLNKTGAESKYRRVAKFLILIGSDQAAEILAELDPDQVDEISKEIALTKVIKPDERDEILAEFHSLFSGRYRFSGSSRGGVEAARRILYAAKGPEKGEELLNRALPKTKENLFSFLEEFSPEQLVMVFKDEAAQTTALILSRLPPKLSARTLSKLPAEVKPEVLLRIAHQKEVSPEVLEQISAALKEKVRHFNSSANDIKIDGMQTLAAILKQGDYSFGDRLVNELERESPQIGKDLKEKLYTLDDIINAVDRPIQEKLSFMNERDIAVLLKGKEQEFNEKILSCVSAGRRKLIRDEYEILGAVPLKECESVTGEFLSWFRTARENGDIILYSDEDVFL